MSKAHTAESVMAELQRHARAPRVGRGACGPYTSFELDIAGVCLWGGAEKNHSIERQNALYRVSRRAFNSAFKAYRQSRGQA